MLGTNLNNKTMNKELKKLIVATNVNPVMTNRVAFIEATFDQMVDIFGEPHGKEESGDSKVQVEWVFQLGGGLIFALHDYKEYSTDYHDVTRWHVRVEDNNATLLALIFANILGADKAVDPIYDSFRFNLMEK